jgi:hypothetical protein
MNKDMIRDHRIFDIADQLGLRVFAPFHSAYDTYSAYLYRPGWHGRFLQTTGKHRNEDDALDELLMRFKALANNEQLTTPLE